MINLLIKQFKNISFRDGIILRDKSYKFDAVLFCAKYLYDYKVDGPTPYLDLSGDNRKKVTENIVSIFNLNPSANGNDNFVLETLLYLERIGVLKKENKEKYYILNNHIYQYIISSMECTYICQYLATYMAFVNDDLWDDYVEYSKITEFTLNDENYKNKFNKLQDLKNKILLLLPNQSDEMNNQWSLQETEYAIVTLGLINDEFDISRTLNIYEKKIVPKDLNANVDGTKTKIKKDNFYINDFRLDYVKKELENYRVNNNASFDDYGNVHDIQKLTVEYVKENSQKFSNYDKEMEPVYNDFRLKFGPDKLKQLQGEELLNNLFYHNKDRNNMAYLLEHKVPFGGIGGGSQKKFGLYKFSKDGEWHIDSNTKLTIEEAINTAEIIRDGLIGGCNLVKQRVNTLNTEEDYVKLYDDLLKETNNYLRLVPYRKYFHIMFPNVFPPYYSKKFTQLVLDKAGIKYIDEFKHRYGLIQLFINECEVSDLVFDRVLKEYLEKYDNVDIDDEENSGNENMKIEFENYNEGEGVNLVIYGTPGCGKSFVLDKILKEVGDININELKYKGLGLTEDRIIRTTFHHDYSNTDFIGQIVPQVDSDGSATYVINPGPFTKALTTAFQSNEPVALVIEELNRGDAAGILGDIFQLLDRYKETNENKKQYKGVSQYPIENSLIQTYLNEHTDYVFDNIRIPSNLYIFATMNTSDQNVFTLDTAFKRRWDFLKMKNNYIKFDEDCGNEILYVPGSNKKWTDFVDQLNKKMLKLNGQINEDKQLGLYFVDKELLVKENEELNEEKTKRFAFKVLEYLWDDIVRYDHQELFDNKIETLDNLIDKYVDYAKSNESLKVFNNDVFSESS